MANSGTRTIEKLQAELATAQARVAQLEAAKPTGRIVCKVSEKGAVSVYGLQKWPVTLYHEQWVRLLDESPQIRAFMLAHSDKLAHKADRPVAPAPVVEAATIPA